MEWDEHAHQALANAGYRAGGARDSVIELLAAEGGCMDAERVVEQLRDDGRAIATASVYRALAALSEVGALRKVALPDAPARFELVEPDGGHHHHAVCERCGRTEPFSDSQLERAVEAVSERSRFAIRAHEVTLQGLCSACRRR